MLGWFKKKRLNEKNTPLPVNEDESQTGDLAEQSSMPSETAGPDDAAVAEGAETGQEAVASRESPESAGLFKRLRDGLAKTRDSLADRIDGLFMGRKTIDPELLDELEEILITSDLGVHTTQDLLAEVRAELKRRELTDPLVLKKVLKDKIFSYLAEPQKSGMPALPPGTPFIIMVIGVNGVGKTTTIGKIARKFVLAGQTVLLVAADTFRAAAIEQLRIWGQRVNVEVVSQKPGADPSSVVYDALDYARPRNFDVVLIDTAGRLHTKVNLMEELKKIKRVISKKIETAPQEILLVLDATTGQNAVSQAKLFHEAVGITGVALTKLDGTAKGGVVINISHELQVPIRFIGIGEKVEDLRDFEPAEFVEALFDTGKSAGLAEIR
jgi:fused signal recognition particle receptor